MAVLSVAACLLLVLRVDIRIAEDRLAEGNLGSLEGDFSLIAVLDLADSDVDVLIVDTVDQRLAVLAVDNCLKCHILSHELRKCLGNLIVITLLDDDIALIGVGLGEFGSLVSDRSSLCGKRITGLCGVQLTGSADVACVKFFNFLGLVALHNVDLARLFLCLCCCVVENISAFDNA